MLVAMTASLSLGGADPGCTGRASSPLADVSPVEFSVEALADMTRKELQQIAKRYNVRANGKTIDIIASLRQIASEGGQTEGGGASEVGGGGVDDDAGAAADGAAGGGAAGAAGAAGGAAGVAAGGADASTCCVCWDKDALFAMTPCGHRCLCGDCAQVMTGVNGGNGGTRPKKVPCPVCRNKGTPIQIFNC